MWEIFGFLGSSLGVGAGLLKDSMPEKYPINNWDLFYEDRLKRWKSAAECEKLRKQGRYL